MSTNRNSGKLGKLDKPSKTSLKREKGVLGEYNPFTSFLRTPVDTLIQRTAAKVANVNNATLAAKEALFTSATFAVTDALPDAVITAIDSSIELVDVAAAVASMPDSPATEEIKTKMTRAVTWQGKNTTGRLLTIATTHGARCESAGRNVTIPDNFRCLYGQYVTEYGTTNISDPVAINKLIKLILPMLQKTDMDTNADDFDKVLYNIVRITIQNSVTQIMPGVIAEVKSLIDTNLRVNTADANIHAVRDRLRWLTFLIGCSINTPFIWFILKGQHGSVPASKFPEKFFLGEKTMVLGHSVDWKLATTFLPQLTTDMEVEHTPEKTKSRLVAKHYQDITKSTTMFNIFPKILDDVNRAAGTPSNEAISLSNIFEEIRTITNNYTFIDFTCFSALHNVVTFNENIDNTDLMNMNVVLNQQIADLNDHIALPLIQLQAEVNAEIPFHTKDAINQLVTEYEKKIAQVNKKINKKNSTLAADNKVAQLTPIRGGSSILYNTINPKISHLTSINPKSKPKSKKFQRRSKRRNNRRTYKKKARKTKRRRRY
jgi:hypothetical protein